MKTMSTSAELARAVRPWLAVAAIATSAACAHAPAAAVDARVNIAPGVSAATLGRVAVPTFEVEGAVRAPVAGGSVVRRSHSDTMEATGAFMGELVGTDLTVLDRQFVDQRIKELQAGSSPRVSDETAPSFGRELGAQTLIVGRYRFECSGDLTRARAGDFVEPKVVHRQSLQIRGFELETGRVIFDVELALDSNGSDGRLLPRSLARSAARRLWAQLSRPTADSASAQLSSPR